METKLKEYFDDMVVFKDLKESNFFKDLNLPSFLRDWLLKMFENEEGKFDVEELTNFVKTYIPSKTEWIGIKNRIVVENERVKLLTRISVDINITTHEVSFSLPDFGLGNKETIIDSNVWDECKDDLIKAKETWGVVELGYRYPEGKIKGKIKLISFQNFCPYEIDLDYYKDVRKEFSIHEWIDVLLGAIDYNASGYEDEHQKLAMLTRLLPFVEKRLNLIELAPYHAEIAQGGTNLSGGQRQRMAIARAVVKKPEIYLFDDSFSALDVKTDKTLRMRLRESMGDSTMLIVAQRVGSILDADRILVMEDGQIVGRGKHRELLHTCPLYREIAELQLGEEEVKHELECV